MCVKEAGLDIVNETLVHDKPMLFYDMIEIGRNPNYMINNTIDEELPRDLEARSIKLDEILHDKIESYFKSRTIKFIMAPAVEGDEGEWTPEDWKYISIWPIFLAYKYRIYVHCFKIILLFHSLDKRYFSDPRFFLCDSESTRKKKYFKFNAIHEIFQFAFGGLSALPVEASKDENWVRCVFIHFNSDLIQNNATLA